LRDKVAQQKSATKVWCVISLTVNENVVVHIYR